MLEKVGLRRIIALNPLHLRSGFVPAAAHYARAQPLLRYSTGLPSVAQTSFWESLIPKPLRRENRAGAKVKAVKSKEWNPATFFIIIMLLIGSMSIQMIALKNSFAAYMRRADAKIDLLREVIEKVQNGEEVDVEGLLGSGDPEKEQEWEEVLREIEKEDELWTQARKKKPIRRSPAKTDETAAPVLEATKPDADRLESKTASNIPRGFY